MEYTEMHSLVVGNPSLRFSRRPFEDWVMEPRCRHRLCQLRDRVDSQDVPALTAK